MCFLTDPDKRNEVMNDNSSNSTSFIAKNFHIDSF